MQGSDTQICFVSLVKFCLRSLAVFTASVCRTGNQCVNMSAYTTLIFVLTTIKSFGGPLEDFQGQGSDDVSLPGDGLSSLHGLCSQRSDHLCPIDQSQPLWKEINITHSYHRIKLTPSKHFRTSQELLSNHTEYSRSHIAIALADTYCKRSVETSQDTTESNSGR